MASLERYMKSGLAFEDAFNKATVQLLAAVEVLKIIIKIVDGLKYVQQYLHPTVLFCCAI